MRHGSLAAVASLADVIDVDGRGENRNNNNNNTYNNSNTWVPRLRANREMPATMNWPCGDGTTTTTLTLLRSTLDFFSRRRAGLRAGLRDARNGEPAQSGGNPRPALGEEDFNAAVTGYAARAPFLGGEEKEGGGGGPGGGGRGSPGPNLMEYAGQRALGRTPPGGKARRRRGGEDLTAAAVLVSAACARVGGEEGVPNACLGPYLRMGGARALLDEAEVTRRLSFLERSELSAVLDGELERAAAFYRARMAALAPPWADGGTRPAFRGAGCGACDGRRPEDAGRPPRHELVGPSQGREALSFAAMAAEVLELHAFITTNVIVVRQVLIKYDAFVRSLGDTPMGSWYQTTRRQRVRGRSSDFYDLVYHSKLRKLTKAYVHEHARCAEEARRGEADPDGGDGASVGSRVRRRRRGLSRAFHRRGEEEAPAAQVEAECHAPRPAGSPGLLPPPLRARRVGGHRVPGPHLQVHPVQDAALHR